MKLFDMTDFVFTHVNLQLVFKMAGFFDKIKNFKGNCKCINSRSVVLKAACLDFFFHRKPIMVESLFCGVIIIYYYFLCWSLWLADEENFRFQMV